MSTDLESMPIIFKWAWPPRGIYSEDNASVVKPCDIGLQVWIVKVELGAKLDFPQFMCLWIVIITLKILNFLTFIIF